MLNFSFYCFSIKFGHVHIMPVFLLVEMLAICIFAPDHAQWC